MFIRSERLFLRPGWPEDRDELLGLICDEQVVRNLATAPWPYLPDHAQALARQPQDGRYPHFFVTLPSAQGARLVGACGIAPDDEGRAELGFWIARDEWGKGYATEAARAVLRLARTLGYTQVRARQFVDNMAFARVLQKVGFRPTGEIRPRYCLSRGEAVPALVHVCELGAAGDCDNGAGDAASLRSDDLTNGDMRAA